MPLMSLIFLLNATISIIFLSVTYLIGMTKLFTSSLLFLVEQQDYHEPTSRFLFVLLDLGLGGTLTCTGPQ